MSPSPRLLPALFAAASVASAQPAPMPSVQLPPALEKVLRDYERAWMAKDAPGLAALFVPDGLALPNGAPPARGTAALTALYASASGSPLSLRALAFGMDGRLAYILGGFAPGPQGPDLGKFTLVLRQDGSGAWRILSDMDNVNALPRRPPAPSAPAAPPQGSPGGPAPAP